MEKQERLKDYSFYYNELVRVLIRPNSVGNIEGRLKKIKLISWFSWYFHSGYFVDARLEKELYLISEELFSSRRAVKNENPVTAKRKVLHIASEVYPTGGHTRLILNIIKRDNTSNHSLALTRQSNQVIPAWLSQAVELSSGIISDVQQDNIADTAIALRCLAIEYDYIFLHVHPDDVIPFVALSYDFNVPLVFINHADHVFNLGTSLVDTIVCTREWSEKLAYDRRLAKRVDILPLPLDFKEYNLNDKLLARKKLGIADENIFILSVASYYKYIPDGKYNFMQLVKKIVDKYDNVIVKVIGVSKQDAEIVGYKYDARIELLGLIENPVEYYMAADFYLDSMPFSSFTALWEAMYFRCFPLLQYDPSLKQQHDDEYAVQGLIKHPANEEELLIELDKAINNDVYKEEITTKLFENINYYYAGLGWNEFLNQVYASLKINENYKTIPIFDVNEEYFLEVDIDAANMPNPYNSSKSKNYFIDILYQNLWFISRSELIGLFRAILKSTRFDYFKAFKTLAGLLLAK